MPAGTDRNHLEGPSRSEIQERQPDRDPDDDAGLQPWIRDDREHAANAGHVLQVPVQADVSTVQRADGHLGVTPDHQQDPHRTQPPEGYQRGRLPPPTRGQEPEDQHRCLDREVGGRADTQGGPDVGKRQGEIQEQERGQQRRDARAAAGTMRCWWRQVASHGSRLPLDATRYPCGSHAQDGASHIRRYAPTWRAGHGATRHT